MTALSIWGEIVHAVIALLAIGAFVNSYRNYRAVKKLLSHLGDE